jgi:hypothetical protein
MKREEFIEAAHELAMDFWSGGMSGGYADNFKKLLDRYESNRGEETPTGTPKFKLGQKVYLTTDTEQVERVITGIVYQPTNSFRYGLAQGTSETYHFDIEISAEKDVLKQV